MSEHEQPKDSEEITPEEMELDTLKVVTIPEICKWWGKSRKSVLMRIYQDDLIARQSSKTWIVSIASVIALWGEPELLEN